MYVMTNAMATHMAMSLTKRSVDFHFGRIPKYPEISTKRFTHPIHKDFNDNVPNVLNTSERAATGVSSPLNGM